MLNFMLHASQNGGATALTRPSCLSEPHGPLPAILGASPRLRVMVILKSSVLQVAGVVKNFTLPETQRAIAKTEPEGPTG